MESILFLSASFSGFRAHPASNHAAFDSGSRRYHDVNLYRAGFGPFLAGAVVQAAVAAAGM